MPPDSDRAAARRQETVDAIAQHGYKLWRESGPLEWQTIYRTRHYADRVTERQDDTCPLPTTAEVNGKTYISSLTIDIHPTPEQDTILRSWAHSSRRMYNATRQAIRALLPSGVEEFTKENLPRIAKKRLRDMIKPAKAEIMARSQAKLGDSAVTGQSLDLTMDLAYANYRTCVSNLTRNHCKSFTLPNLQRDRPRISIKLAGRVFDSRGFYPARLGEVRGSIECRGLRADFEWSEATRDSTLVLDQATGDWRMYVPQPDRPPTPIDYRHNLISIDPGYRTFLTGVSDDHALLMGDGIMKMSEAYQRRVRWINAHVKKSSHRKRKLAAAKRKLDRQVDGFHWRTAAYLTKNYDHIVIGDMSPVRIISRRGTLRPGYKTKLVLLRYGTFRDRLQHSAHKRGVGFQVQDESYTSLACGNCGHIRAKTSSKHYLCRRCGYEADRDLNGARNIYCKHLM